LTNNEVCLKIIEDKINFLFSWCWKHYMSWWLLGL